MDPRHRQRTSVSRRGALYRALLRHAVARLLFLYFTPLLLLALFFHIQYRLVVRDLEARHLQSVAEHQAGLLNMYLGDRLLNLADLSDKSRTWLAPQASDLDRGLAILCAADSAFVDLTVLDESGLVLGYAGPFPDLAARNYGDEPWFQRLHSDSASHVITDVYLGFRGQPHFTMAVKLEPAGRTRILRAALSPAQAQARLAGLYPGSDEPGEVNLLANIATNIWLVAALFCLIGGIVIWFQARWVTRQQFEAMKIEAELSGQLVQASKLAAVGELAAGVAHEINNPLAVIAEKTGLVRDLLDPRFDQEFAPEDLTGHMRDIEEAVYRCSDITRQLLGFVRQTEVQLAKCDVNDLVDSLLAGLLSSELETGGIEVVRNYLEPPPAVVTDRAQLEQVILNILKNAIDAIGRMGRITITTRTVAEYFTLEIADTGCGMTEDQIEQIFMPFFTTKGAGKGTGLGLSVSYRIVQELGGELSVTSACGEGSVFTIALPLGG